MTVADLWKILAAWLALPVTAIDFGFAWSVLPERVPMQFGAHGQVSWSATRSGALEFDLGILALELAVTTAVAFVTAAQNPEKAKKVRVVAALVVGFQTLVFNVVLWRYQVL